MDWTDRLHVAVDVLFGSEDRQIPDNVSTLPRPLDGDDVAAFHAAADNRDNPLFEEMNALLASMTIRYPIRAARMQKEIKWLRKEANKRGLSWGKSYKKKRR